MALLAHRRILEVALLASFAVTGVALRVVRASMLDPFEDGYQRWWISANLLETGQHADMYSLMTQGNWLPFYDYVGAGLLAVFGMHNIWAMKGFNIVLSVGLMGLACLMGRRHSRAAGISAFAFMAFSPPDMILGTSASPDTLGVFAVILAFYLFQSRPLGAKWSLILSSFSFLIGVATFYEAWFALVVFVLYYVIRDKRKVKWKEVTAVALPALAFCLIWLVYVSQWGFLPSIIVSQTSVDVNYQVQVGTQPSQLNQFASFWFEYTAHFAVVFLMSLVYLVIKGWRELEGAIFAAFLAALTVYSAVRIGQPSPRYLYITIPIGAVFAGRALAGGIRRFRDSGGWPMVYGGKGLNARKVVSIVAALALVSGAVAYDAWRVAAPRDAPGTYSQPRQRAGEYLAGVTVPDGKLVVFESPIAAYFSGLPPSKMIGSHLIPQERPTAEQYLRDRAAFVVYVDVPYYPLRQMFPELATGGSTSLFIQIYDANSWEADFGAYHVYVYAINS